MHFLKPLYVGEGIRNIRRVCFRLSHGAGMKDVYVISLAKENGQLECTHNAYLKQRILRKHLGAVVGVAKGYKEAIRLIIQITEETVEQTGTADIKAYLVSRQELKD
ncbi:MAG: hypothetical protein IJC59_01805 [Lachnospiraceae bacterium]|nr:hypothetical protein [Lachnospiraceae bacterium]